MRILSLEAENFKRISVVEIKPTGNLVQITGKNAAGKTSVLDAIWVALAGAEGLPSVPIRKGSDKATISLKLGGDKVEMTATRTMRKRKEGEGFTNTLTVENADGFRAPSPQDMLDKLIGTLAFDPLAFTRMKPGAQFDALRRFVPGVDFDDIAAKNKSDFGKRTEINRDAKRARAAEEAVQVPDSIDAETKAIDEAALTQELARAGQHNATIEMRRARRAQAQEQIDKAPATLAAMESQTNAAIQANLLRLETDVKEIEAEIARLRAKIDTITREAEDTQTKIAAEGAIAYAAVRKEATEQQAALDAAEPLPAPIDTEALTVRITEARHTNAAVRLRNQRAAHATEAEALEADTARLTDAMAAREKEKTDAIAKAEFPVPGLGFGEGEVTINGLPFNQASDAEQLRTSIAIAMASNAKLRVMRVRDGSLLDEDSMKLLAQMAEEKDYQVWIESVRSDGKVGFIMEDGHLQGVPVADEPKEGALL